MATKAQRFQWRQERSGPKRPPRPRRRRRDVPEDTALPGVSATDRKRTSNRSKRAGRKASWVLEQSAGRKTRKSTRKAANRQKPDSALQLRQTRRVRSPGRRAAKAKVR